LKKKQKNFTFSLPEDLVDKIKGYAQENHIPSINAGVKEALTEYVCRIDKEILSSKMAKAAKDPLFMKDLEDCVKDFDALDSELDREADTW
jgi:hypothetical protein